MLFVPAGLGPPLRFTAAQNAAFIWKNSAGEGALKTVIIIGAGATRAEAESQAASRHQRPPLDKDFFELALLRDDMKTHRDRVHGFVKEHFGIDIFQSPRPGMEEVFALVYSSTAITPLPKGVKNAFSSLCRIYAKVIEETTNWLEPRPKGPLCRLIKNVVASGPTSIITFNQDIVIEKCLYALSKGKNPISWDIDSGYCMNFADFTQPSGKLNEQEFFLTASSPDAVNPLLLKPHGSLNWYAKTLKEDAVLSQLKPSHKINCTRRKELFTTMQYTSDNTSGRKTWYTWPIIVPPILEKGTFLGNALDNIWSESWKALIGADRVIVYGYSFPNADSQSQTFFKRAAAKMSKRPILITINPDFSSSRHASSIFNPIAQLSVDNVRAYLSDAVQSGISV